MTHILIGAVGLLILLNAVLLLRYTGLRRKSREQEKNMDRLYLNYLNLQTKPHFLVGCLSIIYSLVEEHENALALDMVTFLTREMRYRYDSSGSCISIGREIERVRNFLDILQLRCPDTFGVEIGVEEGIEDALILPFSIQPLVDNCIRHGRSPGEMLKIRVSCRKEHDEAGEGLVIIVADDGAGMDAAVLEKLNSPGSGIPGSRGSVGIENLKLRLSLLYGKGKASLMFASEAGKGTRVTLRMPFVRGLSRGEEL